MEYGSLRDLIYFLQYDTKLNISIVFFRDYNINELKLDFEQKIHNSKLCNEFKSTINGYENCYKCRNCAIRKAISTQKEYSGLCFNGIFEYVRPVYINGKCVCIICIGNIINDKKSRDILTERLGEKAYLISSAEFDFDIEKCKKMGDVIGGYIHFVYDKFSLNTGEDADSLINNILLYCKNSSQYDINIKHIAECFHYNEQYLGRLFKKKTGNSYNSFLNSLRVEEAKKLILSSKDSMINIAFRVGFKNVTYFNRIFKQLEGVSPKEYRKTTQNDKFLRNN